MRRNFRMPRASAAALLLMTIGGSARAAVLTGKLTAPDGSAQDRFGYTVAVDGETAVVGAPGDNPNGSLSGSAYVFVRSAGVWTFQAKLTAADGAAMASFGQQVAISGETAVIGAPYAGTPTTATTGAAYVFVRSGGVWTQQAKLVATDANAFDYFGSTLSASGNTVAVGTPYADVWGADSGAAYVFTRAGTTWTQQTKIFPPDGQAGDLFGSSVAVDQTAPSGPTLIVGAPSDDDDGIASGSASVYLRTGSTWSRQQKLHPADGVNADQFGSAVALEGDTALVGAPDRDDRGAASGGAYVFVRSGILWAQQQKLVPADGAAGDSFGSAVALAGDTALVGAFLDDEGAVDTGSAYAYGRAGTTWTQRDKLVAADRSTDDGFGVALALDGDRALFGVEQDDDAGSDSGSVFPTILFAATTPAVPATSPWNLALFAIALLFAGSYRRARQ